MNEENSVKAGRVKSVLSTIEEFTDSHIHQQCYSKMLFNKCVSKTFSLSIICTRSPYKKTSFSELSNDSYVLLFNHILFRIALIYF